MQQEPPLAYWRHSFSFERRHVMRGIDFLCQHELVDADRIGMIGHSLGADTTIWAMPFDTLVNRLAEAIAGSEESQR